MPARRRLTLKGYAAWRGCALSTVHQAIREGRLTRWSCRRDPRTGYWSIDPDRADAEWARYTYPNWGGRRT
jgi:hypothetical protein